MQTFQQLTEMTVVSSFPFILCLFIRWPGSHSNGPVNAAQSGYFPVISHIPEAASTSVKTDSDQSDQWLQRRDRGLHHNLKQNMLHKQAQLHLFGGKKQYLIDSLSQASGTKWR